MAFVLGAGPNTAIHPRHVIHLEPPLHLLINTDVFIVFLPADEDSSALSRKNNLSSFRYCVISYAFAEFFRVENH